MLTQIHHILEKGSGRINEDTLFIGDDIFGVFDGATSLDNVLYDATKTGGMLASSIACSVFSTNCHPLVDLAITANQSIHEKMRFHGVDCTARERLWSTSAAVVRIDKNGIEWLQTGDAFILLIYNDHSYRLLSEKKDHDFDTLSAWKQIAAESVLPIYEALKEQLRQTRCGMNRSYGVLNGEKEAEAFLKTGVESFHDVKEIILATDGLSMPVEKPEKEKNFDLFVEQYLHLGLEGVKDHIREIEKDDPRCIRYPRFKCHDDIAAISIRAMH